MEASVQFCALVSTSGERLPGIQNSSVNKLEYTVGGNHSSELVKIKENMWNLHMLGHHSQIHLPLPLKVSQK